MLKKTFSSELSTSLLSSLTRNFPPKEFNESLIDIVNVLMDGLSRGDVYIDMKELPINIDLQHEGWPSLHKKALIASGWTIGENSPIVLNGNVISWRRTHNEMKSTIKEILSRNKLIKNKSQNLKFKTHKESLNHLNIQQKEAISLVEKQRIIMLSGGPGTGKTSTILHMLVLALLQDSKLKIAVAAPTGKAAQRLKDTFQAGIKAFDDSIKNSLSMIPCKTLHKLLEASPKGFRRNSEYQLNLDIIVVDEMSMVDMSITAALLDALPHNCQIIFVGDPDQLLPVGTGCIWKILQNEEMSKSFQSNSVKLIKSYRNQGDIALLRNTLQEEGLDSFWQRLSTRTQSSNVRQQISSSNIFPKSLVKILSNYKEKLKELTAIAITTIPDNAWLSSSIEVSPSSEIISLFCFLNNLLILCPQKHGSWGVKRINQFMLGGELEKGIECWEQGIPIMSGSNQPELGLANGDIGLVIGRGEKRRILFNVFSEKQKIVTRLINPSRMKTYEPAYAMTIHKSQGSEADHVFLLWANTIKMLKGRQSKKLYSYDYEKRLIYTAITRAKKHLTVITDKDNNF